MLTFGIKVNKDLSYFPHIRVATIVHSLTSTTYSSVMSSERVTDLFKLRVSKSNNEGINTNLQNTNVEHKNDVHLNEKQNEETVLKEGELFHPPKDYVFPKIRIGARDRLCQQHWFKNVLWLHYDERYI